MFSVVHHYNAEMIKEEHEKNVKKYDENGEEISVESRQINIRVGMNTGPVVAGVSIYEPMMFIGILFLSS